MLKAGRVVAVLMSLYMAFGLIWTGARDPYMGVDVELYGVGARPSTMVGKAWPASKMEEWSREFDVDVLVAGTRSALVLSLATPPRRTPNLPHG